MTDTGPSAWQRLAPSRPDLDEPLATIDNYLGEPSTAATLDALGLSSGRLHRRGRHDHLQRGHPWGDVGVPGEPAPADVAAALEYALDWIGGRVADRGTEPVVAR